jgi:hypothetical protein
MKSIDNMYDDLFKTVDFNPEIKESGQFDCISDLYDGIMDSSKSQTN